MRMQEKLHPIVQLLHIDYIIKTVSLSWGPALSTFGLGGRDPDSLMSHYLIPIHTISSHASIAPPSTNQIRVRNKLDQSNANEEAWDEIV